MDKNFLTALTQNPDLIPGIYNFCDAWCEKCPFTQKCLKYRIVDEGVVEEKDEGEDTNEEELDKVFQISYELLNQAAQKMGMALPSDAESFDEEIEQEKSEIVFGSQIMLQANKYAELADEWFSKHENIVEEGKAFCDLVHWGADAFTYPRSSDRLQDRFDVIHWYQFIIPSKLFRALRGRMEVEASAHEYHQEDSRGSAKVALLAIDDSMVAWTRLIDFFPSEEDSILPILLLLSGIRTLVETVFPDARSFLRPGFDSAPEDGINTI